jgi:hypothetical protein
MVALVHEDFEYLSVSGRTVSVDATGREALKQSMADYFASVRDVTSVIEDATVTGPYVAIRERVSWTAKSGRRSQAALGVYEVREGLVRRVWYYPAVERSDGTWRSEGTPTGTSRLVYDACLVGDYGAQTQQTPAAYGLLHEPVYDVTEHGAGRLATIRPLAQMEEQDEY